MAYKPKVKAVTEGGTNNTTFTAYSVLAAGTTATGAFQNVSGTGTTGQVLKSNGAGALPTWQALGSSFAPNSTIFLYDDFIGYDASGASNVLGNLTWQITTSTGSSITTDTTTNPGQRSHTALAAGVHAITLNAASTANASIILGGGAITCNWIIKLDALSDGTNTYKLSIGLGDTATAALQANGVYMAYTNSVNSGNWVGTTVKATAASTANSAVAATTTGYHNIGITVNAGATSVGFFVDGVQIANSPLASNIPTVALMPMLIVERVAGTIAAGSVKYDAFYFTQALTTPR